MQLAVETVSEAGFYPDFFTESKEGIPLNGRVSSVFQVLVHINY